MPANVFFNEASACFERLLWCLLQFWQEPWVVSNFPGHVELHTSISMHCMKEIASMLLYVFPASLYTPATLAAMVSSDQMDVVIGRLIKLRAPKESYLQEV